jgi:hypothetical protein
VDRDGSAVRAAIPEAAGVHGTGGLEGLAGGGARHPDLKDAAAAAGADEVFMTSPSPGQIGRFLALASRALW